MITSLVLNGTMTMKTLNTFLDLGESLAGCGKYGNYTVEITESQRVDSTWLQQ